MLFREGNGTPLQHSCLENPMDGGAWWAAVHGVAKSQTWLSDFPFTFHFPASEKVMATHSSVLAWRIPGTGEPGAAVYGVARSRTRLKRLSSSSSSSSDAISPASSVVKNPPANAGDGVWSLGQEYPLEKEMANHSNILARKIPWTGEPGGL